MDADNVNYEQTGQVIDVAAEDEQAPQYYEPTESDKELTAFVVDHTDRWREFRDQNYLDDWLKYERIFRGQWAEEDKTRGSERSRVISPATQQAVETRHAEIIEAIFGQGEFFDIKDDLADQNGQIDVEKLKNQLMEDFAQDKVRKSFDQITLLAEIYGTGIGEITVGSEKQFKPMQVPLDQQQMAYGVGEKDRVCVKLVPVNPKNFLFDPNGTSIDDCMGVAIEKYVSIHKIAAGIKSGKYKNVDIGSLYEDDSLEVTQEDVQYEDDKVLLLTYYGLVPREYVTGMEEVEELFPNEGEMAVSEQIEDYTDMVEAIIVIANGSLLLKAEESPYMMKDRPVISYQADTVPNRLLGRGTVEKAYNMQAAIDGSARSHMDALALTVAPMMGMDATRLPRGAKFEVKPGKAFMTNGNPAEILMPFKFGTNDGQAMQTSKEFERMLLMATGTIDSNGTPSAVARDGQSMDMATATMIKKYKRVLTNFQEDFLIPFIYKTTWRYMQFDPERYPSVDVKFIPTATLGIIAREYEQKQLAFLIQTLGAQSPLTPVLMQGVVKNSSLSNKEQMLAQMAQMSQPNPQQQAMAQQAAEMEARLKAAETALKEAQAEKARVEAQLAPEETKAKIISALANNLDEDNEGKDFERRAKIADLMLREEDIRSNERIATQQMQAKQAEAAKTSDYMSKASELMQ
jgi:hypothetical protein